MSGFRLSATVFAATMCLSNQTRHVNLTVRKSVLFETSSISKESKREEDHEQTEREANGLHEKGDQAI